MAPGIQGQAVSIFIFLLNLVRLPFNFHNDVSQGAIYSFLSSLAAFIRRGRVFDCVWFFDWLAGFVF